MGLSLQTNITLIRSLRDKWLKIFSSTSGGKTLLIRAVSLLLLFSSFVIFSTFPSFFVVLLLNLFLKNLRIADILLSLAARYPCFKNCSKTQINHSVILGISDLLSLSNLVDVSSYFLPDNLIDCLILSYHPQHVYLSLKSRTMLTDQVFCKNWASVHCVCELLPILSEGVG